MPCSAAMIDKFVSVSPEDTVEKTLKALKKAKKEIAVVINKDGKLEGLFRIRDLFKNLLPVSVTLEDDLNMDIKMSAAPGIAKRLAKVEPLPLDQFIDRRPPVVSPETQIWVGVKMLVQNAGILVVVDTKSEKPIGIIEMQTMLDELERLNKS